MDLMIQRLLKIEKASTFADKSRTYQLVKGLT